VTLTEREKTSDRARTRVGTRERLELPRHFTYWRLEPLRDALVGAGWEPVVHERTSATYGPWLRSVSRNPG
jgi:hypothetical protein